MLIYFHAVYVKLIVNHALLAGHPSEYQYRDSHYKPETVGRQTILGL